jgi:hypothetical protein
MPSFKFPSHYVYWGDVEDHESIKSNVLPIIHNLLSKNKYENPYKACNMQTNVSDVSNFLDDETLEKITVGHYKKMILETDCMNDKKPTNVIVTDYWFNMYEKGDFQEMHTHTHMPLVMDGKRYDTMFSLIYILHDEESSPILFRLDDPRMPFTPIHSSIDFNTSDVGEIKEGTLLIFSSHLPHTVLPVKQPGRITIAFNIACCFE